MTLSWRIMRRAWRRVIPIVRSIPSSRVRSKTESTSVLTMPNRLTTTENAEQHVEHLQEAREVLRVVLANAAAGVERRVVEAAGGGVERRRSPPAARR